MSRIGKVPVSVPKEVKVNIQNSTINFDGPKGKMSFNIPYGVNVEQKDAELIVTRISDVKQNRSSHGTVRALLFNMIAGVLKGHQKELEIQGIGFRAEMKGNKLVMNLGFSHPVEFDIPEGVKVSLSKPTAILIEGVDKANVGLVAAKIRAFKKPEPYKGKGIRYLGEIVRRKQGKSVTK